MVSLGTLPTGSGAAVVNPSAANSMVFSYSATGSSAGIYVNSSISVTGARTVVQPSFADVSMLQVSPDGSTLVFVASASGISALYTVPMAGGTPTMLATADCAALSPSGTTIVFSSPTTTGEQLELIPITGGVPTALTDGTYVDLYPQYSKDGTKLVFSSNRNSGNSAAPFDLYVMNLSGDAITQITSTPSLSEFGGSFNSAGTQVSYIGLDTTGGNGTGVYVANADGSGATLVWNSNSVGQSTYWSSTTGRSIGGPGPIFQRMKRFH